MLIIMTEFQVVHSVASVSQATASTAIGQLQYLLTDQGTFRFVADRADAVVQAIVTQTSLIRSRHLNDVNALDEVNELVRTICHFLSSVGHFLNKALKSKLQIRLGFP